MNKNKIYKDYDEYKNLQKLVDKEADLLDKVFDTMDASEKRNLELLENFVEQLNLNKNDD